MYLEAPLPRTAIPRRTSFPKPPPLRSHTGCYSKLTDNSRYCIKWEESSQPPLNLTILQTPPPTSRKAQGRSELPGVDSLKT